MPERQRMTTRLKTLFQRPELFVLAGGINPIGAKMAEALGYDAFYMSGGNTSAHQLGWPDSGTSMRDMVDNARKIVLTVQIPVFADADTGYGDAISTHYTVREYIQAGIAGAHIEDQTFPPKSGPRRRCISIKESAITAVEFARSSIVAARFFEMLKDQKFCQVAGFWPAHPGTPRDAGARSPHAAEGRRLRRRPPPSI